MAIVKNKVPNGDSRGTSKTKATRPVKAPRAGWADIFSRMAAAGDDHLVHGKAPAATKFDEEEWQW
ncbi:MAG: hypothetical protein PHE83_02785 [Opitutaceae bacterium]|nr:hypothetical protein [Opitutaceae bacterium]